jgi:hypothetical protein
MPAKQSRRARRKRRHQSDSIGHIHYPVAPARQAKPTEQPQRIDPIWLALGLALLASAAIAISLIQP